MGHIGAVVLVGCSVWAKAVEISSKFISYPHFCKVGETLFSTVEIYLQLLLFAFDASYPYKNIYYALLQDVEQVSRLSGKDALYKPSCNFYM